MDALSELKALGTEVLGADWLVRLCATVIDDPSFREGIASSGHHPAPHQEKGGLVLHTWEVARAAVGMCGTDKSLAEQAYVAAVFHDFGKAYEYAFMEGRVTKLPFARRIGHIAWGWAFFVRAWGEFAYEDPEGSLVDEVGHAILAHHGRKEWGSPVEPQTRLAFILHTADMLSTKGLV